MTYFSVSMTNLSFLCRQMSSGPLSFLITLEPTIIIIAIYNGHFWSLTYDIASLLTFGTVSGDWVTSQESISETMEFKQGEDAPRPFSTALNFP